MSKSCMGSWHIRPTPARYEGNPHLKKTWTGPINPEMYGKGLKDLCNRTQDNLNRLSTQMKTTDPCLEYGLKHWHPNTRPQSACSERIERPKTPGRWESVEVMFTDNKLLDSLGSQVDEETDSYVDKPVLKSFCYLCSTLEEHERHMQQHRPKRPASAKPRINYETRINYIAPPPKQKPKPEEEQVLVKERLYKVEVYTSDKADAGTTANVFIAIKGSLEILPRTQLIKKRGSAQMCFMRASKEMFHIKGPFLGNLQILSIEHDGTKKTHAWHLDRIDVTDVKAMKTWVFKCEEWLSTYKKPHYSNRIDLQAEEKDRPATVYNIEVHTGKQKMAGTDSNIFITLIGQHGSSKKIHLADPSSDKKLFEKNSVDKFRIMVKGVGELKRIRIEHDGKGFAAGWFLDKVIIYDSERPKDSYYFTYGGWIAKDEGDGKLWRDIPAKKKIPKEIKDGTDTRYDIMVKTGDVRFAGTDANVFIQLAGAKGITPKLKLDDSKNNFERNMVDNFSDVLYQVRSDNVGPMDHIVIGHDNFGPGAGWFLEKVTVRRYIPKDEVRERLKKMRQQQKQKKKNLDKYKNDDDTDDEDDDRKRSRSKVNRDNMERSKRDVKVRGNKKKDNDKDESDDESDDEDKWSRSKVNRDYKEKSKRDVKVKGDKNLFSVSSESEVSEDEKEKGSGNKGKRELRRPESASRRDVDNRRDGKRNVRPGSAQGRPGSAQGRVGDKRWNDKYRRSRSSESESEHSDPSVERRPGSALGRDKGKVNRDQDNRRRGSSSTDRSRRGSTTSSRRVSTSASSYRNRKDDDNEEDDESEENDNLKKRNKKHKKKDNDDDDYSLDDIRVPLYEDCLFECNKWFATDEGDGLYVRELKVTTKNTYYKEPNM